MNKTVDVIERTLEKEKKEFVLVCKVLEVMSIVILIVFVLAAVVVMGVIISMGAKENDVLVHFTNSAVLIFGLVSALNFGRAIFRALKSGETPFRYDIADKVKGASLALLLCSFLSILVQSVSHSFSEAFSDICHYYFFIAITSCFIGLILGIMSYVMSYGCKLQQEADETI